MAEIHRECGCRIVRGVTWWCDLHAPKSAYPAVATNASYGKMSPEPSGGLSKAETFAELLEVWRRVHRLESDVRLLKLKNKRLENQLRRERERR